MTLLAAALLTARLGPASAETRIPIEGEVLEARSRWTGGGTTIVTDSTVRTAEGELVELTQLGGTIDGIGMVVSHHPRPLRAGDYLRGTAAVLERPGGGLVRVLRSREPTRIAASSHEREFAIYGVMRAGDEEPLHWRTGCIQVWLDAAGTDTIPGDRELEVIEEAFETWAFEISAACDELSFSVARTEDLDVGRDFFNLVTFRDDRWCRPDADSGEPEMCYDPSALAVTTTFFVRDPESPDFGELVDAEIEINTAQQSFATEESSSELDLRSTVTHEIGHLLGLAHNCWTGEGLRPRDHAGRPVPPCDMIPAEFQTEEATMYYRQSFGETKKSTLHGDDITGGCAVLEDRECEWQAGPDLPAPAGCSTAGDRGAGAPLLLALFPAGVSAARRGWRRPARDRPGRRSRTRGSR